MEKLLTALSAGIYMKESTKICDFYYIDNLRSPARYYIVNEYHESIKANVTDYETLQARYKDTSKCISVDRSLKYENVFRYLLSY